MKPLAILLCAWALCAQPQFYPFTVDQDGTTGIVDFGFLNKPIGPESRVFVRDGKFHTLGPDLQPNTADDERITFFGVNMVFGANFPVEADAVRIARRLRKLGINIARLHHLDTQPDREPNTAGSILTQGPYPTLNNVAVSRLRTLIDAFKQEGIYINLNLHVGYVFRPAIDNIPALETFPNQSKPVRMIHPRMIELQADFTRKMIDALALNDDPALAMVEVNNETSLVYHWQVNSLERYLEGEYRDALQTEWNSYLARTYESTDSLRASWGASEPDGDNILPDDWRIENQPNAPVTVTRDGDEYRVDAPAASRPIIVKQVGFSVEQGRTYVAEVEMRIDAPSGVTRTVYWDVKQDVSPWRTVTGQNVTLTNEWRQFRMVASPSFDMDKIGRFGISIQNVGLPVVFRNWRLYPAGRRGLSDNESLEDRTISLPSSAEASVGARTNDYLLFLTDRDKAYLNTMLQAVRERAGSLVPVAGTQVGFGGLLNYDSHDDLDYQDNHFYVDHYNFPNASWDSRDWRIRNLSNIGASADAFTRMAATAQSGRPFTVSEFNQPWPNAYAAETDPTLAVFARFQDWDGLMHFAYAHGRGWDNGVPSGFDLNGDWTKLVSFGQSAWLFRSGAISAGKDVLELPVSLEQRLRHTRERRNGNVPGFLTALYNYDPQIAFLRPVRVGKDSTTTPDFDATAVPRDFTYSREQRLWTIHAPQAAGVFGFVNGDTINAGAIGVSADGFIALLATALDGQPIERSARILVTNPGQTLRTQPGASPARPQNVVNYPGTTDWWTLEPDQSTKPSGDRSNGIGPTHMHRVELSLTLRTQAEKIEVYPLDSRGARRAALDAKFVERIDGGFRIHLQADGQEFAPWYEIAH